VIRSRSPIKERSSVTVDLRGRIDGDEEAEEAGGGRRPRDAGETEAEEEDVPGEVNNRSKLVCGTGSLRQLAADAARGYVIALRFGTMSHASFGRLTAMDSAA
jgi:hypothetical protein